MQFKALSTNTLVHHPAYGKILLEYNEILKRNGKVNNKKFYEEVILKEIPTYGMQSWYQFLKRFKTASGIVAAESKKSAGLPPLNKPTVENIVSTTLLSNQEVTAKAISKALNIGHNRLQEILDNPQLMSAKDAIDLIFKAMKAQDSRIHAIGRVREDNREEAKLERAFSDDAYNENG